MKNKERAVTRKKMISMRIDEDILEELKRHAKKNRMKTAELIRFILVNYIFQKKKKISLA